MFQANGQLASPFGAAAQQDTGAANIAGSASTEVRDDLRTTSGRETTASGVVTEKRNRDELSTFGDQRSPSGQSSDAIRRFSSAGSQVISMLTVVNRFQELVRLAGEAYIDPSHLTRVKTLGEGAFAKVVHCKLHREGQPDMDVAVKLLKPQLFSSDLDVKDFINEGIVLKRMRHRSVVSVVGLGFKSADGGRGASPDSLFIVQELCNGGALRDVVANQMFRPREILYTYADGLRWAMQITAGLAHLHASQPTIIHRDLKLENTLLLGACEAYDAKIADFGLHATVEATQKSDSVRQLKRQLTKVTKEEEARLSEPTIEENLNTTMVHMPTSRPKVPSRAVSFATQHASQRDAGGSTHSSLMMRFLTLRKKIKPRYNLTGQTGSFLNMAPEVVLGERYNESADLFSLAIVLYEIFTKSLTAATVIVLGLPHECSDYAYKVARGWRRPCPASWPKPLSDLIQDCWAQDPDYRPTSQQVLERLQAIEASGVIAEMDKQEAAAIAKLTRRCSCF